MKKRVHMIRKMAAVAVAAAMCISVTGCGGSSKKAVVTEAAKTETRAKEKTEPSMEDQPTGINDSEFADILAGTMWAGISSSQEITVAAFDEKDAYIAILDANGELITDEEGYWKADTDTLYLYLNEDYSDDPTAFAFDWYITEEGEYIQIEDAVLSSQGDGSNIETTLEEMTTTASVIQYVADGTYWIGSDDEMALVFYFEDDEAYIDLLYEDNGQIQAEYIDGIWSLDYDNLYLIDVETGESYVFGWYLTEEGDGYCFELIEDDDTTYYLYESAAEDVDSTIEILTSYLTEKVDLESDDIDLSYFLEGYVGHSVIDAFMVSGLSPDFETRKYCAELLGFINYSGTSDENLALIQLMGGTVR
ncbi:hypothetical protein [Enterocloster citroniae]|uniref:DUF4474 domain-containing protein n=2 Tax=Enterocloster citroniae TaxID=358743 RepID=A0A0J9BB14_9FIRM|nr:hypothetical protein [Enterocloster citroniae]KMW10428.1 hypothetical protein HMPREF9470_05570 [[Clostridium] citroniae WAL-19142]